MTTLDAKMTMAVECRGMNKENSGGLSTCEFDYQVYRDGSMGCCLEFNVPIQQDMISLHLISKALVSQGLQMWMLRKMSMDHCNGIATKAIASVEWDMKSIKKGLWKVIKDLLMSHSSLSALESSAIRFGMATLVGIMQMCSNLMGKEVKWNRDTIINVLDYLPDSDCLWTKMQYNDAYLRLEEIKLNNCIIQIREIVLEHRANINCLFGIKCLVDFLVTVKEEDRQPLRLALVICSVDKEIRSTALVRSALCASLSGADYGGVINTKTGTYVMTSAIPLEQVQCVAKGTMLGNTACKYGLKVVPVACTPELSEVSSQAVMHAYRPPGEGSSERMCILLLSHYALTGSVSWEVSDGDSNFEEIVIARKAKEWLSTKVREGSVLYITVDKRTKEVLGNMVTTDKSTSFVDLCASMAKTAANSSTILSEILKHPQSPTLRWCREILKVGCCNFDQNFSEGEYFDTCIAMTSILKANLEWDTVV